MASYETAAAQAKLRLRRVEIRDLSDVDAAFKAPDPKPDAYVIVSLPDNATAAALALNINASVLVSVTTIALLDPEEVDAAVKMSVNYRAPGS